MSPAVTVSTLAVSAFFGVLAPWLVMRMLATSLREGRLVTNYRGEAVFLGLGVVWLVWGIAALAGGIAASWLLDGTVLSLLAIAGPLSVFVFAFGLVDDALGTSGSRGFKGHLQALAQGRLTTGGVKLFGVSAVCLLPAAVLAFSRTTQPLAIAGYALAMGASMALTANFVNLMDLRPGRALKAYSALAVAGAFIAAAFTAPYLLLDEPRSAARVALEAGALLLFLLGPVVAVWRYDLGRLGMLGDAGANPMGAVAALFIVSGLPLWGVLGYLALMLALNLASERVSFSRVIEGNALLRYVDMLGRKEELADS